MKRQLFYLKENNEFIESFESELEPLTWVYRWTERYFEETVKRYSYSLALRELIETNFNLN